MSTKVYFYPEAEKMLGKLIKINDDPDLQDYFYPVLLELAGKRTGPDAVIMHFLGSLLDAILKFKTTDLSVTEQERIGRKIIECRDKIEIFIDTLLQDKEAAERAKIKWRKHLQENK